MDDDVFAVGGFHQTDEQGGALRRVFDRIADDVLPHPIQLMMVEGGSNVLLRNVRFHGIPLNIQFLISAGDVFPQVLRQISFRHGIGEIRMLQHAEVAQAAD